MAPYLLIASAFESLREIPISLISFLNNSFVLKCIGTTMMAAGVAGVVYFAYQCYYQGDLVKDLVESLKKEIDEFVKDNDLQQEIENDGINK